MNTKINTFANVVMPVSVIVITILLFFLFQPENSGALFYINLCYTVLLEGVFFGWLSLLRMGGNNFSVAFRAAMGICALYYVVAGFGWMLLYGLVLSAMLALKWYIALIIVMTLLWLVIGSLLAQTDNGYKESMEQLADDTQSISFFKAKADRLARRCEEVYADKQLTYRTGTTMRTPVEKLSGKIAFITPNVLHSTNAVAQLNAILTQCADYIDALEQASAEQVPDAERKLLRYIDTAISDIDFLKNTARH